MLYIIGIGINEFESLSLGSMEILKNSDIVYVERFTGFISDEFVKNLSYILRNTSGSRSTNDIEIKFIKRWFIEDGREILKNARNSNVCILVYGDPLVATTYNELLVRARKQSIEFKVVHSSSGILSLMGESGLQPYKFGKMVTMMDDPMSSITVYNTIYENMCLGLHTLILTEYNNDDGKNNFQSSSNPFFLSPSRVIDLLLEREKEIKLLNLSVETYGLVATKIGHKESTFSSGKIKSLLKLEYDGGPNSIIIPGKLHFTEVDSIKYLTSMFDDPTDNTERISRLAHRMLNKYIPNTKAAVDNMYQLIKTELSGLSKDYTPVIENAENYLLDAQIFYNQGKLELAILSVGYAEGLIDSIRFQKNMNPW
ncbi:diphthine synthase [Candidatus Nitrosocosmicus arcticus]|uniref:Putative diphthine synthase n=1 Tax=Candidatus Nitrosocosmicus arcticus TaxID=2035267 RepID=A0A557SVJ9_9ARCH|nr:diphthine synthase [Candidatus Nitrosocosmicus arcticus]TVP40625.1 putative diphthine synthase [Candidatus Nitrosocosmicus arcticus]